MLLHDVSATHESEAVTAPDVERVRAAIAQLPPAERDLLVLRLREDLDTVALAARLGTSQAHVHRRLHHAGWVVQDVAGVTPGQWGEPEPSLLRGRPSHLVEEEAAAGITPLLAARIAAAVAGEAPAADEHWRVRSLARGLRAHVDAVLLVLLVVAVAVPVAVALAAM